VEGEPTIDNARVRLTDIAPSSALPTPGAITGQELAAGSVPSGVPVTVQGSIIETDAEGFTLDMGGTLISDSSGRTQGVRCRIRRAPTPAVKASAHRSS